MEFIFEFGRDPLAAIPERWHTPWRLFFIGLSTLLFGAIFAGFLSFAPLIKWEAARRWEAVPCSITESKLDSREGTNSKGRSVTRYKINIQYQYVYQGYTYTGTNYSISDAYSATKRRKRMFSTDRLLNTPRKSEIISQYPKGSEATCYVDPKNPSNAVISRAFSGRYLVGLIGLAFVYFGAMIMYGGYRERNW